MRGTDTSTLQKLVTAASGWRTNATTQGVSLFQINAVMPDGRPVVLAWNDEAILNADGTHTGDWLVTT